MKTDMDSLYARASQATGRWSEVAQLPYPVEYTAIARYLRMTENRNPLYSDPEYAARTRHQRVVMPPLAIFGICEAGVREALEASLPQTPGRYGINLGQEYEFYRTVRVGDHLRYRIRLAKVEIKPMKYDQQAWWIEQEICYLNQQDEPVCLVRNLSVFHRSRDQIEVQAEHAG